MVHMYLKIYFPLFAMHYFSFLGPAPIEVTRKISYWFQQYLDPALDADSKTFLGFLFAC